MDIEDEDGGTVYWDSWDQPTTDEALIEREERASVNRIVDGLSRAEKWILGARFGFFDPGPHTYRMIANQARPLRSPEWAREQVLRLMWKLRRGTEVGVDRAIDDLCPCQAQIEENRIEQLSELLGFQKQEGKW